MVRPVDRNKTTFDHKVTKEQGKKTPLSREVPKQQKLDVAKPPRMNHTAKPLNQSSASVKAGSSKVAKVLGRPSKQA